MFPCCGTNSCGFCQAAAFPIDQVLSNVPELKHVKVEDDPGSFTQTIIPREIVALTDFLKDGQDRVRDAC